MTGCEDERVMGCTLADLSRWLAELTGDDHAIAATGRAEVALGRGASGQGVLVVEAAELPRRRIALLDLPRLDVRFRYDPAFRYEARAWIERFDRHTQRGGG